MLPNEIIVAMRKAGALRVKRLDENNQLHFEINFRIVKEQFPVWLETLVYNSLGVYDQYMYTEGYVAYVVQQDGMLLWKPTRRLHAIIQA
jgi:hypothetical protein